MMTPDEAAGLKDALVSANDEGAISDADQARLEGAIDRATSGAPAALARRWAAARVARRAAAQALAERNVAAGYPEPDTTTLAYRAAERLELELADQLEAAITAP